MARGRSRGRSNGHRTPTKGIPIDEYGAPKEFPGDVEFTVKNLTDDQVIFIVPCKNTIFEFQKIYYF